MSSATRHTADVFTTVSHITAYEARRSTSSASQVSGVWFFAFVVMDPDTSTYTRQCTTSKASIPPQRPRLTSSSDVRGHFYGDYGFDLDNTLSCSPPAATSTATRASTCSSRRSCGSTTACRKPAARSALSHSFLCRRRQLYGRGVEGPSRNEAASRHRHRDRCARLFESAARFQGDSISPLPMPSRMTTLSSSNTASSFGITADHDARHGRRHVRC
ncbi:hypothetical protein C8J57DRAFT_233763 [Mycena rebaudengoi]|nr:hypothetical protein C8J57DRAFT_233763 [Mycena rebaudengoi]